MSSVERLNLDLGARSYEILVGSGLLATAGQCIKSLLKQPRVIILSDRVVADLYLATLTRALDDAGIAHDSIIVPAGEQTKSFGELARVIDSLLAARIERGTTLIALGGGVIGDLGGFAASIVLRGIDFIQIPTTLLAQVDSSVGGKTGINTSHGKNLVGSFYQPRLVLADIDVLSTLSRRELAAGYAEVAKYGLIGDAGFFGWLESHAAGLIEGDKSARQHAVLKSCAAKAAVVAADEREAGARALLNFGHTFGHALEAECGYSDELLHGEAVAAGMIMAFDLSARLGLCPLEDAARVSRHLASVGLPATLGAISGRIWDPDRLIDHMQQDKKVADGKITFVLARGIGDAFLAHDVDLREVHRLLQDAVAQ